MFVPLFSFAAAVAFTDCYDNKGITEHLSHTVMALTDRSVMSLTALYRLLAKLESFTSGMQLHFPNISRPVAGQF